VDHLALQGENAVGFAEPYHDFVKKLLVQGEDPWTDVLLFALDRWLLRPRIAEWLSQGKTLVSSRSIYCSLAYQGAQGVKWEEILRANRWRSLRLPDLCLILDVEPGVAFSRCSKTEKFEREDFLELVRAQYLGICRNARRFPTRIVLIDANATIEEVLQKALKAIGSRKQAGRPS